MSSITGTASSTVVQERVTGTFKDSLRQALREIDIENLVDDYFETNGNYSRQSETKIYGLLDRMDLNKNGFLNLEEFYRVLDPTGNSEDDSALYFNEADAEAFLGPQPMYVADFESLDGHSNGADWDTWKSGYTLLQSLVSFLQQDKFFGKIEVRPVATSVRDDAVTDSGHGRVNPYDDPDHPLNETEKQEEASEKFVEVDEFGLATEETPGLTTAAEVMAMDFDMSAEDFVAAIMDEDNEDALIEYAQGAEWEIESLDDLSDFSNEDIGELRKEFFFHSLAESVLKSSGLDKLKKSL